MRKIRILILITLTLLIVSCKLNSNEKFTIQGVIKGDVPEYLFLFYENKIDSVLIEKGKFYFEGKVDKPVEAYFHIPNYSNMVNDFFYLENENIQIEIFNKKKQMKGVDWNSKLFSKIDNIISLNSRNEFSFNMFLAQVENGSLDSSQIEYLYKN